MPACRICDGPIEPFIDFGRMPLANGFLTPDQFADEFFFNLSAAACPSCTLIQLVEQPPAARMFHDRYPFFTASSAWMTAHFERLAADIMRSLASRPDPFVVEIGSNDGTLLRPLAAAGVRHAGVEPSASVAAASRARGIETVPAFFDGDVAGQIAAAHGSADAVIAANALSHVPRPHDVVSGIDTMLAADGIVIIEDPYWGDVVARTAFDQIYDEHASYFTLSSLSRLFEAHGLAVFDVTPVDVHGGSMRYFICRSGARSITDRVATLRAAEQAAGLHLPATLSRFATRISATGEALRTLLRAYRSQHKRVVGYGATSKSTTAINHLGITPDDLEFICDTTPAKHDTFSPGAHIPVRSHEAFARNHPDRALLFLWNHAAEVRAKEQQFERSGGRWFTCVPDVQEL